MRKQNVPEGCIPAKTYRVRIIGADVATADDGHNYLLLTHQILEPEYFGRCIRDDIHLWDTGPVCGRSRDKMDSLQRACSGQIFLVPDLLGEEVLAQVVLRPRPDGTGWENVIATFTRTPDVPRPFQRAKAAS